eukprot:8011867-Alexandrium_andersonii.AAC.1
MLLALPRDPPHLAKPTPHRWQHRKANVAFGCGPRKTQGRHTRALNIKRQHCPPPFVLPWLWLQAS